MVIERFAKSGARVAGTAAGSAGGSFFGGILGNPIVAIVLLALGGLLIFRKDISGALSNFKLPELPSLPDFKFPDITFPSLPDFNFPEFSFPEIKFPDFNFPDFNFPDFDFEFPDIVGGASEFFGGLQEDFDQFIKDSQSNLDAAGGGVGDFFGGLQSDFDNFISGLTPKQPLTEADQFDDSGLAGIDLTPSGQPAAPFRDAERFARDFPEITTEGEAFRAGGGLFRDFFVENLLQDQTQDFTGGGVSFTGGSVRETPISELSLSQIIDRFNVSASQAADIRARARDDFGDFDFGTNTGSGIGSIFQDPLLSLDIPSPNVSNPAFQGLTAREISRLITQGILSPQFLS